MRPTDSWNSDGLVVASPDPRARSARVLSPGRLRLWLERSGDGFRLRDAETEELVRREDPRIRVIPVAGVTFRLDAVQDDAFAPGRRLALVPEPDNVHDPHAIAIWDEARQVQAGYVPAEVARELDAGEWQAVSLHEFFEENRRAGLRVLLAPRDAWIGMPRA
jgi:HIRAN domain